MSNGMPKGGALPWTSTAVGPVVDDTVCSLGPIVYMYIEEISEVKRYFGLLYGNVGILKNRSFLIAPRELWYKIPLHWGFRRAR